MFHSFLVSRNLYIFMFEIFAAAYASISKLTLNWNNIELSLGTFNFSVFRLMLITIGSTLSKTLITMISDIRRVDMGTRPLANITCLYQTGAFKQWHTWRMKMVTNPLLHTKDSLHILTQTRCLGHCVHHSIVWHSRNDATAIIYWSQMMLECMIKVRMCSCPFWKWGIKGK